MHCYRLELHAPNTDSAELLAQRDKQIVELKHLVGEIQEQRELIDAKHRSDCK